MYVNSQVSCIIIFLNTELYLQEAIDSVFAQSYSQWELILVDDGSTDGSTNVALEVARKYPDRVLYLEHENHQNLGMSASRNLGIQHSRGEFVAFLDADDVWLTGKLEQQLEIFNTHPDAGMIYGRTLIWHSWTGKPEAHSQDRFLSLGVVPNTLIKPPKLLSVLLQGRSQTPTTCNAIIRRTIVDQVGAFENSFRGVYEDQVFFSKVLLHTPVFISDQCWAKYRQHPESCYNTAVKDLVKLSSTRLIFLNWLRNYFYEQKVRDFSLWFLLLRDVTFCQNPHLLIYWSNLKESLMQIGRKTLPSNARDWLWSTFGHHL